MGDDKTKRLILARRARFVAAALASMTSTTVVIAGAGVATDACGGETDSTSASSSSTSASSSSGSSGSSGGEPRVCLSPPLPEDAETPPQPCLSIAADTGAPTDATTVKDATIVKDADPMPCLAPPLPDQ